MALAVGKDDETLVAMIEAAVQARGGTVPIHLLPTVIPQLRRMLLDRRLLPFLESFPTRFEVSRRQDSPDIADVKTLHMTNVPAAIPGTPATLSHQRATCVVRELADAVVAAVRRFPERGAAQWGRRENLQEWVPLAWLMREKTVGKRLQAHVLHSPRLEFLHHQNSVVRSILGEKGALWATQAAHLREVIKEWLGQEMSPLLVRERQEVPCSLEGRGVAAQLSAEGYECPCRIEVAYAGELPDDGGKAADMLLRRIHSMLTGRGAPVHAVGLDMTVQAAFRRCAAARDLGLLRWLQDQPCFEVTANHSGSGWWVVSKGHQPSPSVVKDRTCKDEDTDSSSADGKDEHALLPFPEATQTLVEIIGKAAGVIAVRKLPGVTTECVLAQLRVQLAADGQNSAVTSVSRLDAPTSGVLIAALGGPITADALKEQYANREVSKEYVCLCRGKSLGPVGHQGEICCKLRTGQVRHRVGPSPFGREAVTRYSVVGVFSVPGQGKAQSSLSTSPILDVDELSAALQCRTQAQAVQRADDCSASACDVISLLRVWPLTGRTHQIRVHMQLLGNPIVGDYKYDQRQNKNMRLACPRLFLHCLRVQLRDIEGKEFVASDALAPDLACVLSKLQLSEVEKIAIQNLTNAR